MDESLQELENELKRLRPRAPSSRLLARLEVDLAGTSPVSVAIEKSPAEVIPFRSWFNWRAIAATAAAVVFAAALLVSRQSPVDNPAAPTIMAHTASPSAHPTHASTAVTVPSAAASQRYQPVGAASVLYDLREDAQVNVAAPAPFRRLRYRYVDTYTWKNPATNASLKWSVPRDEVRVIPASMH